MSTFTITVSGLSDDVIRALQLRAKQRGHSMEAEVRGILTAAAQSTEYDRGFGTFLTATFAGDEAPAVLPRSDLPGPVDMS